jgi:hypothetical protein
LGALEVGATIVRAREHLKWEPPLSNIGSAWSWSHQCQSSGALEVRATMSKLRSAWSGSHQCQSSRALEVGATILRVQECLKWEPPSLELGSTWR